MSFHSKKCIRRKKEMCKVIAIANQKGGVGKTTTTVNLGIGLARKGKRVVLIDADPQGSMTVSLGIDEPDKIEYSLANVLMDVVNEEEIDYAKIILKHEENIDFIPANIELAGLEVSMVNVMSRELVMKRFISNIKERKTNDEEYEIISGHRRTHAARLAGIEKVPVIIRELSDDDATIVMVDSNIQREEILPSEKAYAFQMKLEAIQHKGIKGEESREVVGEANGLSGRQVSRYIKLTNLLPELLEMVDEKKIAIKLAVEIAELSESEQQEILDYFNLGYKVSLEQVKAIKNKEKSTDIIERSEEKTQQSAKVTISRKKLKQYFPENYTSNRENDRKASKVCEKINRRNL